MVHFYEIGDGARGGGRASAEIEPVIRFFGRVDGELGHIFFIERYIIDKREFT